jgi:hypothetical protein
MNGASADPCVRTISKLSRSSTMRIGPSHHFFRTFMNAQSSARMERRLDFELFIVPHQ